MQSAADAGLLTSVPTIDEVLHDHMSELGPDFIGYRNHVYRVVNLCAAMVEDRPVSIADFFATICTVIGVDYTKEYEEPGRPIRIVDKGEKVIKEIL